jgi:hypothetical protein
MNPQPRSNLSHRKFLFHKFEAMFTAKCDPFTHFTGVVDLPDQVTCTLLPSRQWDSSPLLDHVTQLSE